MAVLNYTGWATNVNKVILDATTITVGQNATSSTELENGHKRTARRGYYVPDTYQVTMDFDWVTLTNGKSEYQRFIEWYKYEHQFGAIPFEFPQILYSASTGITVIDSENTDTYPVEYYKITSELSCSKNGDSVRVTMTWETVYGGELDLGTSTPSVSGVTACKQTYIDILFATLGTSEPTSSMFTVYAGAGSSSATSISKTGFMVSGYSVRIFYSSQALNRYVTFSFTDGTTSIAKDSYYGTVSQ